MAGPAYQWGEWRFEPSESRLLRGGVIVALPAKTLDLLATLLNRAPRLVTKEEILATVWTDAMVEEGNIAFHVAALRKVLDEGSETSAIETVRGRGYRFVHELSIHQLPPTENLRRDAVERALAEAGLPPTAAPIAADRSPTPVALQPRKTQQGKWVLNAFLALAVVALVIIVWRQSHPATIITVEQFEIVNPPPGQENFPHGLRTYLKTKLEIAGIKTAEPNEATARLSGQLHPRDGGFVVTLQLTRASDGARIWDWSFEVPRDAELPPTGVDDARSRLQGVISTRAAEGLASYLNLSGSAPVTR